MDKILHLDHVDQYNRLYGLETLHPLVSVINLNEATRAVGTIRFNYGVYALFLKLEKACDIKYGRQKYDYEEGTIVCFAPGQTAETTPTVGHIQTDAYGIIFHPDLLRGTSLNKTIKNYTFFSYEVNEALHVSGEEQTIILDCLKIIRKELEHDIDKHSKTLIATYIELLLGYCMRFYERQFVTREDLNLDALARFERLLDDYLSEGVAAREGLPSVRYFADKICLSPNYFGDLVKKETGKSAQEYIQLKMIDAAKESLLDPDKTIGQVAGELGFQYPQHFVRFFRRHAGCTPNQYRTRG